MIPPSLKKAFLLTLMTGASLATPARSLAQAPADLAAARRWTAAKFAAEVTPSAPESSLLVYTQSGPITKNEVQGHHLLIADKEYTRGLHFSSDGKVRVMLSAPARWFEAIVGVDSNDLGYYSNAGRGSVVVVVFSDTGERYLTTDLFQAEGI